MDKMRLRKSTRNISNPGPSHDTTSEKENTASFKTTEMTKKTAKRPGSPVDDDSLVDFKSPKLNLARNTIKLVDNTKNVTRKKQKRGRKRQSKSPNRNQMSIEATLLKPPAFVCPLCLKSFSESAQQIAHSKNCALRNNVTTKQLLEAVQLHERQAEERLAIGLPATPIVQTKKKPSNARKLQTNEDPDVALAIALSKSLSEAQEMEDVQEAIALASESDDKFSEMSSSQQRKSTLASFGFVTNKPAISDCLDKPKRRKPSTTTVLQTRTEEVRNRLLAERIAEAIIDNVEETQLPLKINFHESNCRKIAEFKSKMLQKIYRLNPDLWNGSQSERSHDFYYVMGLSEHIGPLIQSDQGSKGTSSEEMSNHRNSELDNDTSDTEMSKMTLNDSNSAVSDDKMYVQMTENCLEHKILPLNTCNFGNRRDNAPNLHDANDSLAEDESKRDSLRMSVDVDRQNDVAEEINEKQTLFIDNFGTNKSDLSATQADACDEMRTIDDSVEIIDTNNLESLNPLALSWSKMINSPDFSDTTIYVKNNKIIFSHFVVLWTRCRELEKDLMNNSSRQEIDKKNIETDKKYIIMWEDIDYKAAIIFLEFIYCACIINIQLLGSNLIRNDIKKLAKKYSIEELHVLLKKYEDNASEDDDEHESIEEKDVSREIMEENAEKSENLDVCDTKVDECEEINSQNELRTVQFDEEMHDNESKLPDGNKIAAKMQASSLNCDAEIVEMQKFETTSLNSDEEIVGNRKIEVHLTESKEEIIKMPGMDVELVKNHLIISENEEMQQTNIKNIEVHDNVIVISEDELEVKSILDKPTEIHKCAALRPSLMSASPDIFDGMESTIIGNSFEKIDEDDRSEEEMEDNTKTVGSTLVQDDLSKIFEDNLSSIQNFSRFSTSNSEKLRNHETTLQDEFKGEKNYKKCEEIHHKKVCDDIEKTKNNISLFIAKIQRRNARFLESDTDEDESLITAKKLEARRNPFKKRTSNDNSGLLSKFRQKNLLTQETEENSTIEMKKSALGIFEDDIKAHIAMGKIQVEQFQNDEDKKNIPRENTRVKFYNSEDDVEFVDTVSSESTDHQKTYKQSQENNENFGNTSINSSCNGETDDVECSEANESMYTAYIKTHRNNSIDKYRPAVNEHLNEQSEKYSVKNEEKSTETSLNNSEEKSKRSSEFSSFDFDNEVIENCDKIIEENIPTNSQYVKNSQNDENKQNGREMCKEIAKNRRISMINQRHLQELSSFDFYDNIDEENLERENSQNSSVDSQKQSEEPIDLTQSDGEDDVEKLGEEINTSKETVNQSPRNEEKSFGDDFGSMDWNNDNFFSDPHYNVSSLIQIDGVENPKIPENSQGEMLENCTPSLVAENSKINFQYNVKLHKDDKITEDTFNDYPGSQTVTEDITKLLKDCGILTSIIENKNQDDTIAGILSPIILSSDSESEYQQIDDIPDDFGFSVNYINKNKPEDNLSSQNDDDDDDGDGDVDDYDYLDNQNYQNINHHFGDEDDVLHNLSNLNIFDVHAMKSSTQKSRLSVNQMITNSLETKRLSYQRLRRSTHSFSVSSDEEIEKSPVKSSLQRSSSVSPCKNTSIRHLHNKSQSAGHFFDTHRNDRNVKSHEKPENFRKGRRNGAKEEICKYLDLTPYDVNISYDAPLKENFESCSSPELKRKLASYGLKNQKRHRALKLLNFIYDHMHPLVPENLIPTSDGGGSSSNKTNRKSNVNLDEIAEEDNGNLSSDNEDHTSNDYVNQSYCPEEMEFSDSDDDKKNNYTDELCIKENFQKLLKRDAVLYRKILMYEPISLEIFVEKFKHIGIKIKPKILVDYLNSECISFYIEAPKKRSGNIRKKRKK